MTITTTDTPDAEALRVAMDRQLLDYDHAQPCIVHAVSSDGTTVDVVPAIRKSINLDGNRSPAPERVIKGVPIHVYGSTTLGLFVCPPISVGDEGLIIAMDRAMDNWQAGSGAEMAPDMATPRHSDFTDGVFIPGVQRNNGAIQSFPNDALTMQNRDGTALISLKDDEIVFKIGDVSLKISASGIEHNGVLKAQEGMQVAGTVTGAGGGSTLNVAVPIQSTSTITSTGAMFAPAFNITP